MHIRPTEQGKIMMKKKIRSLLLVLALCLCCAAHAEALPAAGEYALFGVETEGYLVQPEVIGATSSLRLDADGTGLIILNGNSMEMTRWTVEGSTLSAALADGSGVACALENGVLKMDIYGNGAILLYYGHAQADLSAWHPLSEEEFFAQYTADHTPSSRLYALWLGLVTDAGVHLRYDVRLDYVNAGQSYDVHGKDGIYYSQRASRVSGLEGGSVTFFRDGAAYNLNPETRTGVLVTTTSSSLIANNVMQMDRLYAAISANAQRMDFFQEPREVDGVTYAVEVFPAESEYQSDAAFYFDETGNLRYCQEINPTIGESFYTLLALDGAVDESLFDVSGYTIE